MLLKDIIAELQAVAAASPAADEWEVIITVPVKDKGTFIETSPNHVGLRESLRLIEIVTDQQP